MAKVITNLGDAIGFINTIFEADSTPPVYGDEDYSLWTSLINLAVNIWENEEGILWKELFVDLADASDGDKTTDGTNSYDCPTDFVFANGGYVWLGTGANKTQYAVIRAQDKHLYENNSDYWCYFLNGKLEFNPNLTIDSGLTITYEYYKTATALTVAASTFEMSDPMFTVYYALSELKKEEGDTTMAQIASQKLAAMVTKNMMGGFNQA